MWLLCWRLHWSNSPIISISVRSTAQSYEPCLQCPCRDKRWHRGGLVCGGVRRYEPSLQCTQDVIYDLHILWSLLVFPWRCKLTSPLPNNLKSREQLREAQGVPLKMKSHELTFSQNFCVNNDPWESGDISLIVGKMEASMGQSILKKRRKVSEDFRSLIA